MIILNLSPMASKSSINNDQNFDTDVLADEAIDVDLHVYRSVAVQSAGSRSLPDNVLKESDITMHGASPVVYRDMPLDSDELNYRGAAIGARFSELQMKGAAFGGVTTQACFGDDKLDEALSHVIPSMHPKVNKQLAKSAGPAGGVIYTAAYQQRVPNIPNPPDLPAAPYFLERDTYDVTDCHAKDLHNNMIAQFEMNNVDYKFSADKWKFTCLAYPNQSRVDFIARGYLRSDGRTIALEFQRRWGCCLAFRQLLGALRTGLRLPGCDQQPRFFVPPAMMDCSMDDDDAAGTMTKDDIEPITDMVESPFPDVQKEGVKIIATAAENPAYTRPLAEFGVIRKLVEQANQATDSEFRRCAACALHNYLRKDDQAVAAVAAAAVSQVGGIELLERMMSQYVAQQDLEVQRQATSALLAVANSPNGQKLISQQIRNALANVEATTSCKRLRLLCLRMGSN